MISSTHGLPLLISVPWCCPCTLNSSTKRKQRLWMLFWMDCKKMLSVVRYWQHLYLFFTDNRGNSKRKWEDSEVLAVERHMMRFIHTCKVPQKIDCIPCINAEPNLDWSEKLCSKLDHCLKEKGLFTGLTIAISWSIPVWSMSVILF